MWLQMKLELSVQNLNWQLSLDYGDKVIHKFYPLLFLPNQVKDQ